MSAYLRGRKDFEPRGNGQKPANFVVLIVFFVIGVFVLIPLALPFGLVWCIVIGKALFKELKALGVIQTNVEGKLDVDWKKAKDNSQRGFDQVRAYSKSRGGWQATEGDFNRGLQLPNPLFPPPSDTLGSPGTFLGLYSGLENARAGTLPTQQV